MARVTGRLCSEKRTKVFLLLFFVMTVIYPVFMIITKMDVKTLKFILTNDVFFIIAKNSVTVTLTATFISVIAGFCAATAVSRCKIPALGFLSMLFITPMLIPSISHGMGLINLLGSNGIITNLIGVDIGLYGFTGIVIGSFLYSFPVAYIILSDAMRYIDGTLYDAAEILGITGFGKMLHITLPHMKRPLISAFFAVFTMIFTDYGVPLAVGGRFDTLPVYLYKEVIGRLNFSIGAYIGLVLVTPALISFLIDYFQPAPDDAQIARPSSYYKKNHLRDFTATSICYLLAACIILPILSFIVYAAVQKFPSQMELTLYNVNFALSNGMGTALLNSIFIAIGTSCIGSAIAYLTAYATVRMRQDKTTRLLHLFSISSLAIPGIVLGLGYIIAFKSTFFYGTLVILMFVNIAHFGATPYIMCRNALQKLDMNLEPVARTLGIPIKTLFLKVIVPSTYSTLIEMFSYFFINAMMTISAVAFLYTVANKPLALLIPQFESQLAYEAAAVVSLVILTVNLIFKTIATKLKKKLMDVM